MIKWIVAYHIDGETSCETFSDYAPAWDRFVIVQRIDRTAVIIYPTQSEIDQQTRLWLDSLPSFEQQDAIHRKDGEFEWLEGAVG